jgi:hypothetical protein
MSSSNIPPELFSILRLKLKIFNWSLTVIEAVFAIQDVEPRNP